MTHRLRVLYAEDSAIDADLTSTHFRLHAPQIELEVVDTARRCLARLETGMFDVLLLDNHLPDMDGTDVLQQLAVKKLALPVVMVTGIGDEALVVQVLRLGASDYVAKERNYLASLPSVLDSAVTSYRHRQVQGDATGTRRYRILYVEHDAVDIDLTQRHFATAALHFDLQIVRSSTEGLAALEQDEFDLVLADLRMPDLTALDLLREARHRSLRVPFIVLTGKGDEDAAVTAFRSGASDYIVKRDSYLNRLPYAIENAIGRSQLVDTNQRLQTQLAARERAEEHIRRLHAELEHQVVHQARALEAANQELEETGVLELIAQSAPLTEVCARLATLLARRMDSIVSVTAFLPSDRTRLIPKSRWMPSKQSSGSPDTARTADALLAAHAIAKPDGTVESATSAHLAGLVMLKTLGGADRLASQVDVPIRSEVTNTDLGRVTIYREAPRPFDNALSHIVERCTRLGAIAIHRAHSEERIRRQALEDPLTGVPNRVLWCDRLDQALGASHRDDLLVAVLLYDLDRFKDINDTLGHDIGDRMLRHVAAQLERSLRPSDTVGRLGGDEFAVVLPRLADPEEAQRIAQRGLTALEQPLQLENVVLKPKASVGLAFHPTHGADAGHLLRCADVAMYRAKRSGGGISTYDPQRDREQLESLNFVAELRRAIDTDQLLLYYQPKIDLQSGRAVGVECLVRWHHPVRGVVHPVQFIPFAESVGLIKPLSLWVIRKALQDCRSWYDLGLEMPVAINLSAPLLYDPELPDTIEREMREHRIREGHLEVEITEGTLMLDPEQAMNTISRLRRRGIAFALDDFGTGYSSLAYLKSLQVQWIKVDQSFVRDMVTVQRDASIVKAAIELGHSFSLDIVAEGVESRAVSDLLLKLGCDQAQGYYFAKPLISAEFLTWYGEHEDQRRTNPDPHVG